MNKTLGTLWSSFRYHFLQIILLFIAFFSWLEAKDIGSRVSEIIRRGGFQSMGRTYRQNHSGDTGNGNNTAEEIAVAITSGFTGGAIAMGLITSICIFGVVWLEINKSKP